LNSNIDFEVLSAFVGRIMDVWYKCVSAGVYWGIPSRLVNVDSLIINLHFYTILFFLISFEGYSSEMNESSNEKKTNKFDLIVV
jgi:hypothetical protein